MSISRNSPCTSEQVLAALRTVYDPDLHKDLVTLGMIKNIRIDGPKRGLYRGTDHAGLPAEGRDRADVPRGRRAHPRRRRH